MHDFYLIVGSLFRTNTRVLVSKSNIKKAKYTVPGFLYADLLLSYCSVLLFHSFVFSTSFRGLLWRKKAGNLNKMTHFIIMKVVG